MLPQQLSDEKRQLQMLLGLSGTGKKQRVEMGQACFFKPDTEVD